MRNDTVPRAINECLRFDFALGFTIGGPNNNRSNPA
jgi:hypothetical protein